MYIQRWPRKALDISPSKLYDHAFVLQSGMYFWLRNLCWFVCLPNNFYFLYNLQYKSLRKRDKKNPNPLLRITQRVEHLRASWRIYLYFVRLIYYFCSRYLSVPEESFSKTLGTTVILFAHEKSRNPELMFIAFDNGELLRDLEPLKFWLKLDKYFWLFTWRTTPVSPRFSSWPRSTYDLTRKKEM